MTDQGRAALAALSRIHFLNFLPRVVKTLKSGGASAYAQRSNAAKRKTFSHTHKIPPDSKRTYSHDKNEDVLMSRKPKKTKTLKRAPETPAPTRPEAEEVGYGKPPKRTQFQPGQSGNPKGRPKGVRNLATNVRTVLGRRIPVLEHGRRKFVSAAEAILHRYLEMAIKGNVKAGAFLLSLLERLQPAETEETATELSEHDNAIVDNLFKQIGKKTEE